MTEVLGRSARKRLTILSAGRDLFLSHGYQGTSVDQIAATAEVSKQTVYKHFGDKHELLLAIVDILGDAATEEVLAAWGEAYQFLAKIFIDREQAIYDEQAAQPGGWNGYRPFRVDRKVVESDVVTSWPSNFSSAPSIVTASLLSSTTRMRRGSTAMRSDV